MECPKQEDYYNSVDFESGKNLKKGQAKHFELRKTDLEDMEDQIEENNNSIRFKKGQNDLKMPNNNSVDFSTGENGQEQQNNSFHFEKRKNDEKMEFNDTVDFEQDLTTCTVEKEVCLR